jgi:predicted ATP-grasp superfamily ATP-dependent carboligase
VKPLLSHEWARHFPLHTKALMLESDADLAGVAERWGTLTTDVMLTEFVPGPDDRCWSYIAYLDPDGAPLMEATKQRIRQFLPGFGSSTYTLLEWNQEVARAGLRFLQGVGAVGPVYVEFKRDPRDNDLKLIECNHRFTGPTGLVRKGGLDMPLLTYNQRLGIDGPIGPKRRDGIALWAPWLDFRAFLAYRAQGEESTVGWLRSLARRKCYPIASARDPYPSMVRSFSRLRAAIARRVKPARA